MDIWESVKGNSLSQGDLLHGIALPVIPTTFPALDGDGSLALDIEDQSVIIVSQSCDLEQRKIQFVVVASVFSLDAMEAEDQTIKSKWKLIAQGRFEALHLLHGPDSPTPRNCLVVDFRRIASLPFDYVKLFAENYGDRWRLSSPYLESMSQAFGRFFMRVALPVDLPRNF